MKKSALFFIISTFLASPCLMADVLRVGANETYQNLNHAMHNVQDGDTVVVTDGVYPRTFTVYNSVVIMAENLHKAEIGDGSGNEGVCKIMKGTVVIDGFKFNANSGVPAVLVLGSQTDTVRDCVIRNNAIYSRKSGIMTSTFSWNCTIENNLIKGSIQQGIKIQGNGKTKITGNTIEDFSLPGIHILESPGDTVLIRGNTISGGAGHGVEINRPLVVVERNTIRNNQESGIGTTTGIPGIIVRDSNLIEQNGVNGIYLENSTSSEITGNIIRDNGEQGIMAWSESSSIIRNNTIDSNKVNGILSFGSGRIAGNTISSNQINGIEITWEAESVVIDSNLIESNTGNGVLLWEGATLRGNTISGNGWMGIFVEGLQGEVVISDGNQVMNNVQHGILVLGGFTDVRITDNIITGNGTGGFGMDDFSGILSEGNVLIEGNIIDNNYSSGIRLWESDGTQIVRNNQSINGNREGIHVEGSAIIENNPIKNNWSTGIEILGENDILIIRDTIAGSDNGIFIQQNATGISIENCLISGNKSGVVSSGTARVRRTTIKENNGSGVLVNGPGIDLGRDTAQNAGYNTIYNNSIWNISNQTSDTVWACQNYWHLSDTLAIDSTLYDTEEDPVNGPVMFVPFISDDVTGILEKPALPGDPVEWGLEKIYPNPLSESTTIRYRLNSPARVTMKVLDMRGREVETLLREKWQVPGSYQLDWNVGSGPYPQVRAGTYLIRMQTESGSSTRLVQIY